MIYKDKFDIRGTDYQNKLITDALDKIKFDWSKVKPRFQYFKIAWANLNSVSFYMDEPVKQHAGPHPEPTDMDVFTGELRGRKYVLGVFYPYSGDIFIDNDLIHFPIKAAATVSAEIAHLVDFFLPLTDVQRVQIMALMLEDDPNKLNARAWWEGTNEDYSTVYYSLPGEGFMQAFTLAYSDLPFDGSRFVHTITKEQAPRLRQIIGIPRTDEVMPTPAPEPIPEPVPIPQPEPEPTPEPTPEPAIMVKYFKGSKVYHELGHYPNKAGIKLTIHEARYKGLYPCKTCKP